MVFLGRGAMRAFEKVFDAKNVDALLAACNERLPLRAATRAAGWLAAARLGPLTHLLIRAFIARFGVDMSEMAQREAKGYATFNEFFARPLARARTLADASLLVPADGTAGECGAVHAGLALQAKGSSYSVQALLGGDAALARRFEGGQFATVYLSPRDYHRVHMPCDGWLTRVVYVPGALMSVAPRVVQAVPGLFARNERVVCVFETAHGPLALVLVGAAIVGSVQLPWQGRVMRAAREAAPQVWDYSAQQMRLVRGQEMGRFLMGSTVVMLWRQPQPLRFEADWRSGARARQGQALANTH